MTIVAPDREAAAKGGVHSGISRRREILERADKAHLVTRIIDAAESGDFGTEALIGALEGARTLAEALSTLPVGDYLDATRAAAVTDTLFKLHRLATGQSTSNQLSGTVDAAVLTSRLADAQARLAELTADTSPS